MMEEFTEKKFRHKWVNIWQNIILGLHSNWQQYTRAQLIETNDVVS